jgi:hypothetical protein
VPNLLLLVQQVLYYEQSKCFSTSKARTLVLAKEVLLEFALF